jgi:hypothetical protein
MVESFRKVTGKAATLEYRYYISSKELTAEQANLAIRAHWSIESMHWIFRCQSPRGCLSDLSRKCCRQYSGPEAPVFKYASKRIDQDKRSMKQKRYMTNLERVLLAEFATLVKHSCGYPDKSRLHTLGDIY